MTGTRITINHATTLGEVTLDHLRIGHSPLARMLDEGDLRTHEAEQAHDAIHHGRLSGQGGSPVHAHAAISGVCEAVIHAECAMIECQCPCHAAMPA